MYYVMLGSGFGEILIDRNFEDVKEAKKFFNKIIKDYKFGGYKSKKLSSNIIELYDNNSFYHVSLNEFKE